MANEPVATLVAMQELSESGITVHVPKSAGKTVLKSARAAMVKAAEIIARYDRDAVESAEGVIVQGRATTKEAAGALDEMGAAVGYTSGRAKADGSQQGYFDLLAAFVAAGMKESAIRKARSDLLDQADPQRKIDRAAKRAANQNGKDSGPSADEVLRTIGNLSPADLAGILADVAVAFSGQVANGAQCTEDVLASITTSANMLLDTVKTGFITVGPATDETAATTKNGKGKTAA